LLAFHKPKGIVCTTSSKDKNNIVDYIGYEKRIYPIGRLDKDSEGLILLTNEGELSDRILRGSNYHEKEYVVTLNKDISDEDLQRLREGVPILDTVTRPCRVYRLRSNIFRIILTQGLNRQIRRMCEYLGYRVVYLKRIRIMNIMIDGIEKGKYREVTQEEWQELRRMLHDKTQEKMIAENVRKRREEAFREGKTSYRPEKGDNWNKNQKVKENKHGYQKGNASKRTYRSFK
jgi:23S rRNA pseudouridine2604 synthase